MFNQFRDAFSCLESHKVKYVIIGGVAVIIHGVGRTTIDLDILIEATPENAKRLIEALLNARLGTADLIDVPTLLSNEITIFSDRIRLDVQTSTPGLLFSDAWDRKVVVEYGGQRINVASLQDLIASKEAAGRRIDMEDAVLLRLFLNDPDHQPLTK